MMFRLTHHYHKLCTSMDSTSNTTIAMTTCEDPYNSYKNNQSHKNNQDDGYDQCDWTTGNLRAKLPRRKAPM